MSGFCKSLCGGKKDVNVTKKSEYNQNHKTIRANKFLGVNDTSQTGVTGK